MKNKNILNIALITVFILLIPFVAMQFTRDVNWGPFDFIVAGILLFGTGLVYELGVKKVKKTSHRIILGVVLVGILFLVWADLAVDIFNIPGISGS